MNLVPLETLRPGRGAGRTLGVRPEHVRLVQEGGVRGTVTSAEYHGADTVVTARIDGESLLGRVPGKLGIAPGAEVRLGWDEELAHLFDTQTGRRVDLDQAAREVRNHDQVVT
jgi:sn-glycerol 3-phosphate transport system ATP-binding protein